MRLSKDRARRLTDLKGTFVMYELDVKSSPKLVIGRINIAFKEKDRLFEV